MTFRGKNRHDQWQQFFERMLPLIRQCTLPEQLFSKEETLVDFLTEGRVGKPAEASQIQLANLDDEQFLLLEQIVNCYFIDGWVQLTLTAFSQERLRRFGRYA